MIDILSIIQLYLTATLVHSALLSMNALVKGANAFWDRRTSQI